MAEHGRSNPVLVIAPDENRVLPLGSLTERLDDGASEGLSAPYVLWVLLGILVEVGIDDAHLRQPAVRDVGLKVADRTQVVGTGQDVQGVDVGGELQLGTDRP